MPPRRTQSPAEPFTPHPLRQATISQPASDDVDSTLPDAPNVPDVPDVSEDSDGNPKANTESGSGGSLLHDAKTWFDNANNNRNTTYDTHNDDGSPYFQKRDSSGDEANHDVALMSPQHPPPFVPSGASFMPSSLGPHPRATPHSSSADDYRSVIDDLTIENKRLKEELKRYRQSINRDVLEKEKLFEIKVHGLPRRKKQELEATLRDFAASLGDSPSSEGTSQRKREKSSASSKERSSNHHHHAHSHNHSHDPAQYSSGGSRSKHASNSSSRSRPVDSAYASMSTGAQSSGPSLARQPFGGSKARASSEQKVERYLEDIPQGLHPNYGLRTLGDKDKKKLIVRRLEQLFTGKIGGRFARQGHSLIAGEAGQAGQVNQANQASAGRISDVTATLNKSRPGPAAVASSAPKAGKRGSDGSKGSGDGDGGSGSGPAGHASAPAVLTKLPKALVGQTQATAPPAPTPIQPTAPTAQVTQTTPANAEPFREARIRLRNSGHKNPRSQDNVSTSNSNSNGDDTANGSGNGNGGNGAGTGNPSGNGHTTANSGSNTASGNGNGNGTGKSPPGLTMPEQRPTRPLDLDPDRVQVPSENMEYIRHLGLVPPEIGPKSIATTIDVSPDANGWVYLNLLSNLAQLHIFNVAPDFIRQAVVEKSTKFQLSPDGQKIRWRGGTDGTKFSSDGSAGDQSQKSTSADDGDGSDEVGHRKRTKTSGQGSTSGMSSGKKRSKYGNGMHNSGASSSFQYKPLFVRQTSSPMRTAEDVSTQDSDMPDVSTAGEKSKGNTGKSKTKGSIIMNKANHHHSMSMTNSNSNIDISRYGHGHGHGHEMSRSGSSNNRKRRKSDGVVVYYNGMPFCTDLAGDSGGETSPTTDMTSTGQTQDSVDEVLQGRPTIHRSSSGSLIPFRPLTDYLSLSREEWAGLGLLGIGTVGRGNGTGALGGGVAKTARSCDNMSSSASYSTASNNGDAPDNEILFMEQFPAGYLKGLHPRDGSSSPVSSSYLGGVGRVGSGGSRTDITTIESREPHLEASGLSGIMPDDHFSVRVTTQRPFRTANAIEYDGDDADTDAEGDTSGTASHGQFNSNSNCNTGAFSMSSLARRVAALKKQTAPISAAVATLQPQGTHRPTPPVVVQYLSVVYGQREPVALPQPAMFYPPFSQSSESEESSDMLDDEANMDDEDSSMFASSSVISRRANPHHSVNRSVNQSVMHASEMMSSGEDGDVEAGEFGEMEDSM